MLADPRATAALVDDFAAQWLNLRRVGEVVVASRRLSRLRRQPAARRSSRRRSCSSPARSREDRSVSDLLRADYTFVNERLARHYGIPGIYGSRFRRVTLPEPRSARRAARRTARCWRRRRIPTGPRRCCAANGCSTTSSASPVPPPPPGVDTTLPEIKPGTVPPTIRERLAQHRHESRLRQLPCGDRSAGLRAREFRRDRRMADDRRIGQAGRCHRHDRRAARRSRASPACGRCCCEQPDRFPDDRDREAPGLRARPAARVLRSAGGAADRPRRGGATTIDGRRSILGIVNSPTFLMRAPRSTN